jgi:hypothetical protein
MTRNISIALIVLLLAGLTAFVLWPETSHDPSSTLDGTPALSKDEASDRTEATHPDEGLMLEASTDPDRVELLAEENEDASNKILEHYLGEDGFTVLVIDEVTEQVVPGADLYLLDRDLMPKTRGWAGPSSLNPLMRKLGLHYRADAAGSIRIPNPSNYPAALAEKDGYFGFERFLNAKVDQATIKIHRNQTLTVWVTDAAGAPSANAPVELQIERSPGQWGKAGLIQANSDGQAIFEDMATRIKYARGAGDLYVAPHVPMIPEQVLSGRAQLTEEILAAGEVHLTMPEVGKVHITVLNSEGEAEPISGYLMLYASPESTPIPSGVRVTKDLEDGMASFDFVALNTTFEVLLDGPQINNQESHPFPGPTEARPTVEIEFTRSKRDYVSGTLLDPNGKTLAEHTVRLRDLVDSGERLNSGDFRFKTDSEGRFRHEIAESAWLGPDKILLHKLKFVVDLKGMGKCEADYELHLQAKPNAYDLGELSLIPMPTLLAGKVLNQKDEVVRQASVYLEFLEGADSPYPHWYGINHAEGSTDSEGNFHLYGAVPESSAYRVWIRAPGYQELRQEVTLGLVDQVYRLGTESVLLGQILIDSEIPYHQYRVSFSGEDRPKSASLTPTSDPSLVDLEFKGLADTPYSLSVTSQLHEVLYQAEGITLLAGQEVRPPDLQPLDLRGKLRTLRIEVQNSQGDPLNARANIFTNRVSTGSRGPTGVIEVTSAGPIDKIEIHSSGYASQVLIDVDHSLTVVLEPALEVFVQLPAKYIEYRNCKLTMQPDLLGSKSSDFGRLDTVEFDQNGRVKIFLPELGKYHMVLWFTPQFGPREIRNHGYGIGGSIHDITASGQEIVLEIDQKKWDARIDKLLEDD